ncbi:BI1-like protein [Cocos nucifera]|uniref:BI1-like protein n=1 Tax=Cocos nucifera TaxID=13894 RepID=A0A8K0HX92_COCNU|nr:BI1-like protein [Cocos nucifera]
MEKKEKQGKEMEQEKHHDASIVFEDDKVVDLLSSPPLPLSRAKEETQSKEGQKDGDVQAREHGEGVLEVGWPYQGLAVDINDLLWGFVCKVYSILTIHILFTTIFCATAILCAPVSGELVKGSFSLAFGLALLPICVMFPLYLYQQKHPLNFIFLGLFTICLSLSVGVACANTQGRIVLEALILTSAVVASLTGYTFWASKKGKDFSYLGPILFAGLLVLLLTSFIQIFFPLGSTSVAIFGGLGAIIFSAFLVYDTDNLIKRYTYDEYIWASVVLYLDILNLFLSLLNLLRGMQSDG